MCIASVGPRLTFLRVFLFDRLLDLRTCRALARHRSELDFADVHRAVVARRNEYFREHMASVGRVALVGAPVVGLITLVYAAYCFIAALPFDSFFHSVLLLFFTKGVLELRGFLALLALPIGWLNRLLLPVLYLLVKVLAPMIPALGPLLDLPILYFFLVRTARCCTRRYYRQRLSADGPERLAMDLKVQGIDLAMTSMLEEIAAMLGEREYAQIFHDMKDSSSSEDRRE